MPGKKEGALEDDPGHVAFGNLTESVKSLAAAHSQEHVAVLNSQCSKPCMTDVLSEAFLGCEKI